MPSVSPDLLDILVCPACRKPVRPEGDDWLVCIDTACGLRYPVRDGIPVMLIEEAEKPTGTDAPRRES